MRQLVSLGQKCCEPGLEMGYGLFDLGGSKALVLNKLLPEGSELLLVH